MKSFKILALTIPIFASNSMKGDFLERIMHYLPANITEYADLFKESAKFV